MKKKLTHWADITADKIIRERGDLDEYVCASGITPSGTVHIGNFREIISVELVVRALRDRGKNVRFIYSWDDYDVFRKVPNNMPNQKMLENHLRFPITEVPDPFEKETSYARYHEVNVEKTLPKVGINPEYIYQSEMYQSGKYADGMRTALNNREKIKECLNHYRDDAHKIQESEEYWPVAVFCSDCKKDTTEMVSWDGDWTLAYKCECSYSEKTDLRTSKGVKLGWRVDWPMRWQFEQTVFEPAGKDHHSHGGSFDTAKLVSKEIFDWEPPVTFRYDFIGTKGTPGKMSSSKGEVISLAEVLDVYQSEVARFMFAGTRPNTEFTISFDLDVLKIYEDYDKMERIAWGVDKAKSEDVFNKEKRIYELSQVGEMPESISYQVPFRHLCNLLQINDGDIDAVIEGLEDVLPTQVDRLRSRLVCAWYWITECAPDEFRFSLRNDGSKAELNDVELKAVKKIRDEVLPSMDEKEEKEFSQSIYAVAKELEIEPKAVFKAVYNVLIDKDQGPRLASFMKIIGKDRLVKLFEAY